MFIIAVNVVLIVCLFMFVLHYIILLNKHIFTFVLYYIILFKICITTCVIWLCRNSSQGQSMIIGSLPKSDALRYRCHTILSLQKVMAQLHAKAAAHMPAQAQLKLLAVLQVGL